MLDFAEFTAHNFLTNQIHEICFESEKMKLRVPLCFRVAFRGFTALVVANPPIKSHWMGIQAGEGAGSAAQKGEDSEGFHKLVHGHTNNGAYKHDPKASLLLAQLSHAINLKVPTDPNPRNTTSNEKSSRTRSLKRSACRFSRRCSMKPTRSSKR